MLSRVCLVACLLAGLVACSGGDPEEEGGLIGTGIIRGTVSENKVLVAERIEIKAGSGEKSEASLNANRNFSTSDVEGNAPFLLRTDLGNGDYRYALAYEEMTANIHSYSDVVIRSWFATLDRNIDSEFNSNAPIVNLPSLVQYNELADRLFAVIGIAFPEYNVTGDQLLSSDYNANDSGIDQYLDDNPVVIKNDSVTVLLTDPGTQIQNETRSKLSLSEPMSSVTDTISPQKVVGVRALGTDIDEIVIIWDPGTDNVGVVAYQVFRDGNNIGTTPFPVFTDTGLVPGSSYEYHIVALDGAGIPSVDSDTKIGLTLSGDTQPPPVPANLTQVEASAGRIVFIWSTDVSEVVSFVVYRGEAGQTPEPFLRTTSTEVTDPSVSGGTEYCYQVEALGGGERRSGLSEIKCFTTEGSVVTPGSGNTNTVVNTPSMDSGSCFVALQNFVINTDLTLSEPCYNVNENITVGAFADLKIEAGTVLRFAQGVGITITGNGSMAVNGTPEAPVVFTGMENVEGFWRGIHFDKSNSMDNQINNAVVEFAGADSVNAALKVTSTVGEKSRLRVQGSVFRFTKGFGISIANLGTRIDAFDNNVITENDKSAHLGPLILPMLGSNNDFSGNLDPLVDVPSLTVSTDLIIPNLGVPLKSNGLTMEQANLTINAGAEIRFQSGAFVQLFNANLSINGTSDAPVLLTGLNREPGFWGGVHLNQSPESTLENVTIEYAGRQVARFNANLALVGSNATVSNVTLQNSSGFGVALTPDSSLIGQPNLINNVLQQ